jgi:hypothetical protein
MNEGVPGQHADWFVVYGLGLGLAPGLCAGWVC